MARWTALTAVSVLKILSWGDKSRCPDRTKVRGCQFTNLTAMNAGLLRCMSPFVEGFRVPAPRESLDLSIRLTRRGDLK
jgi:hypothetical protein